MSLSIGNGQFNGLFLLIGAIMILLFIFNKTIFWVSFVALLLYIYLKFFNVK